MLLDSGRYILKRIHVAARVKQHLHDSLGSRGARVKQHLHDSLRSRGQFQNASSLAFVSPRFCLQSLSFAILRRGDAAPPVQPAVAPPRDEFAAGSDERTKRYTIPF